MNKKLIAMALASGYGSFPFIRDPFKITGGTKGNEYKPHQGKQECARRLKRGTAAYYCSQTMVN